MRRSSRSSQQQPRTTCAVQGCKSKGVVVHRFPNPRKCRQRLIEWIKIVGLGRMDPVWVYKTKYVCAMHFTSDCSSPGTKRLNVNSYPTINLPNRGEATNTDDDYSLVADPTNPSGHAVPPPPPQPQPQPQPRPQMTMATMHLPCPHPLFRLVDDDNEDNFSEIYINQMKLYRLSVEGGKFGWKAIGDHNIPFITRNDNKVDYFVPTRMVNITKYLRTLHLDIFKKCLSIGSFLMSRYEADLLTFINKAHCDSEYGKECFYGKIDTIVRLEDVIQLYSFLECCTKKLKKCTSEIQSNTENFGFIHLYLNSKINAFVPFIKKDGQKCVPLFFFEGQIENLNDHTFKLEGWDLTYLKFCCRVQDIKAEFYNEDSCAVVNLDYIVPYFEPETIFEDFWPSQTIELSKLMHSPKAELPNNSWFKKPYHLDYKNAKRMRLSNSTTTRLQTVVPLPTLSNLPTSGPQKVASLQSNTLTTPSTSGQQIVEPLPLLPQQLPIISNTSLSLPNHQQPINSSNSDDSFGVGGTHYSMRNGNQMILANGHTTVNSSLLHRDYTNVQAHHRLPQHNLLNTDCVSPQIISIDSVSQNTLECNEKNRMKPPEFKIVDTFSDPTIQLADPSVIELIRIQERDWQIESPQLAYDVNVTTLQGKNISFINKIPYNYSVWLVTLKDVVKLLIPFTTIEICGLVFQNELHKTLYCGNTEQISLLYKNGVADNQIPIRTPLINLLDVNDNLEELELNANLLHEKYFKK